MPDTASSTTTSRLLTWLAMAVPGVGRVRAQVVPFAQAWQAANTTALQRTGPLWVALGDSLSQGIGARDISGSWVAQLHASLPSMRLVNLSVTGARIDDVIHDQIPRMRALGVAPDLVTVLIGANDMVRRSRRPAAVQGFSRMLTELPDGVTVVATLPRRNTHAQQINALIDAAARTRGIRVADTRDTITLRTIRGTRAEDHFHPNERGYAAIAAAFTRALG